MPWPKPLDTRSNSELLKMAQDADMFADVCLREGDWIREETHRAEAQKYRELVRNRVRARMQKECA